MHYRKDCGGRRMLRGYSRSAPKIRVEIPPFGECSLAHSEKKSDETQNQDEQPTPWPRLLYTTIILLENMRNGFFYRTGSFFS